MTGGVSHFEAMASAIRDTARATASGVLQVRARGARPATASHIGAEVVLVALHALDRDEGLVVTREHETFDATVVGRDESLDIALVRAPGFGGSPLTMAETDPEAAQLMVAVARSWQGDLFARLTSVSGVTRPQRRWRTEPVPTLLRTDLAPSRGVSGGVLVDPSGRMQAWLTTGLGRGEVLGVPAPLLAGRVARLLEHGRIRRGYIGLAVQPVMLAPAQQTHGRTGVLVSGIDGTGPAAVAGLFVGDVLLAADGQALPDPGALQILLPESRIGTELSLRILRGTAVQDMKVTVGERGR